MPFTAKYLYMEMSPSTKPAPFKRDTIILHNNDLGETYLENLIWKLTSFHSTVSVIAACRVFINYAVYANRSIVHKKQGLALMGVLSLAIATVALVSLM